jgi:SulP family sulfate permease
MSNFGAAFFNGYPVMGGFARTAVNNEAGANTTLASIFSAGVVMLTLLFFTALFYNLPNAVLAAVVLVAVSGLIDLKEPVRLWKKDRSDFAMLFATFAVTLTFGIEPGILAGMVLSLVMVIYRASNPHMARLGRVPGTNVFRNVKRFDNLETREELLIVRIDGPLYFANTAYIKGKLDTWVDRQKNSLKLIVMNMESVTNLDSTGAHELYDWINDWRAAGYDVCVSGTKGPVRDKFSVWGLIESVGADHMFLDDESAVSFFDQNADSSHSESFGSYATQSTPSDKD